MTEQRSTAIPPRHPAYERRWLILAFLLLVELMDLLDSSVVNTAIPAIRADLHSGSAALQWIAGGYALTYAVGLVTGARLGDIHGRRRIIQIGLLGFTATSLLCALAPSTGVLIGARLVQGAFAAIMIPQGFGILKEVFPDEEIGQVFGIFGPVIGIGAILGPIIGGGLVDLDLLGSGWRLVFFVNLPIGLIALAGCARVLPATRPDRALSLDVAGATIVTAAATVLVYPLIQGREHGWPAWMLVAMASAIPLLAIFWRHELRRGRAGADPLIEPSVFRRRAFTSGLVVALVFFCGMAGVLLVFTLYLQLGQHFSALHAGLTLVPLMLGLTVGAGLSGAWLGPRYGRLVIQGGALVTLAGIVALVAAVDAAGTGVTTWQLLAPELAMGLGIGLLIAPLFEIVLAGVAEHEVGSATGVLNAVQQLGSAVGVAVLGTIFFSAVAAHGYVVALERALWVNAALIVLVLVLSPLLPERARHETAPAADADAVPIAA
jgi:EmrB/QacA subfamily drug resistance transporter